MDDLHSDFEFFLLHGMRRHVSDLTNGPLYIISALAIFDLQLFITWLTLISIMKHVTASSRAQSAVMLRAVLLLHLRAL